MKKETPYIVEILSLSLGKHTFNFSLGDEYLAEFDTELQKGKVDVSLVLDKSETMIQVDFSIKGSVELVCDRSLEEFSHTIELEEILYFKYGEQYQELSEELYVIPFTHQQLEFGQFIYEFIVLSLPVRKIHPKFAEESLEDEFTYSTGTVTGSDSKDEDSVIDPRWDSLKKLKFELNKKENGTSET